MNPFRKRWIVIATVCLGLCACEGSGPDRKPVYGPVTGQVLVDGQAAEGVLVACHDIVPGDGKHPTLPMAITDAEGRFQVFTYDADDGAPAGEYRLTFCWQPGGKPGQGPVAGLDGDYLNGRYANPATSQDTLKVESGPVDLGTIQLTTK